MGKFSPGEDENENGLETEKDTTAEDGQEGLQARKEKNEKTNDKTRKTGSFCEICNKKFRSRYHLKLHSVVHTGEKNYLCGICRKSYQQKWNLITHMARVHGKEKPFRCTDCGKAFGYSSHFKRHIKTHFVEKMKVPEKIKQRILNPYNCDQCQKNFDSKYRLEMHQRKHSGSKPFMCDKCGMGFAAKRLVNNHIAKHHLEDLVCDKCGDSFSQRAAIAQHLTKVHGMVEPTKEADRAAIPKKDLIPCEVCGKTVMRTSMRKHLNIHYRNRVYACRFCKKEFLESGQRMVHERKHTGEKPYLCDLCGKGHSQYGNLIAHRKRSHNLKEKPQVMESNPLEETDSFNSHHSEVEKSKENQIQTSGKTNARECTDKAIEEFLKIAGNWINKKFEDSKFAKNQSAEVEETVDGDVTHSVAEERPSGNEKEVKKEKCSIRQSNGELEKVKKQMNNNIFDKIIEDLATDIRTKEVVEKILRNRKNGEKDSLREFLKSVKNIPDNKVIQTIDEKTFWFCWICNGKFANRHLLARHLIIHEPKEMRPYKCDLCRKTFAQSNNYKEHLMSHTNQNQFYCEKCGNGFRHKSHFNVHMRKHAETVRGEKPKNIKCSYCDKTFNSNFHRSEHARTHTMEKPYLCRICGRQFAALSTLTRHSRAHTDARYQCRACLKFFKQKSSLKRHERGHAENPDERIRCECGKSFSQKPSLKKHKMICRRRTDPIVKPFPCVLCPKRFLTKSDLKRHAATHDPSKNFQCKVCSVRLKTGETYSRHLRRHNNIGE